jgi:hypothetical protein
LKYTDPSGHYVAIAPWEGKLRNAWHMYEAVAPADTRSMNWTLKSYSIVWRPSNIGAPNTSFTAGDNGPQEMFIDAGLKNKSDAVVTMIIAHESYHAREGKLADSIFEEIAAYQYQSKIGFAIISQFGTAGLDQEFWDQYYFAAQFDWFDLSLIGTDLDDALAKARAILEGSTAGGLYGIIPDRPPSNPVEELNTDFDIITYVTGFGS